MLRTPLANLDLGQGCDSVDALQGISPKVFAGAELKGHSTYMMAREHRGRHGGAGEQQTKVGGRLDPLEFIAHQHNLQNSLCDVLEKIADGLPNEVDRNLAATAASMLRHDLPLLHRDEEDGLFPLLELRCPPEDHITALLAQLALEHKMDDGFSGELAEALDMMAQGQSVASPEALGYMLRGFFESYRRHLYWENHVVLPIARKRLFEGDLQALADHIQAHRREAQFLWPFTFPGAADSLGEDCACRSTCEESGKKDD